MRLDHRHYIQRLYVAALAAYIAADIWLFHKRVRIEELLAKRG